MNEYEQYIEQMNSQNHQLQTHLAGIGEQPQIQEPGLIKEQLNLGEELEIIDNLLNSRVLVSDPNNPGKSKWEEPQDESMIILSPFGVHHFRQVISGYINKNKLLSNYEEERILEKMKDIATVINDDFIKLHEKIFHIPSIEWCKQQIAEEISEELQIKRFASEITGVEYNSNKELAKKMKEVEGTIKDRIEDIRKRATIEKIKKMEFLIRFIQDTIEDTYNRALGGQERRSLRQTMAVTEARGGFNTPVQQPRKQSTFGWLKPKK